MMRFVLLFVCIITLTVQAKTTEIYNIKGYTLSQNGELKLFTKIAFSDDKIIAIGDQFKVSGEVTRIDGKGKVMLPGLIDAHGHLLGLGENLMSVDLRDSSSEAEAVQQVSEFVSGKPHNNGWIVGGGAGIKYYGLAKNSQLDLLWMKLLLLFLWSCPVLTVMRYG